MVDISTARAYVFSLSHTYWQSALHVPACVDKSPTVKISGLSFCAYNTYVPCVQCDEDGVYVLVLLQSRREKNPTAEL